MGSITEASRRLLTVYEAEAERGIPYSTLLRLIRSGELPTVKLPGRRRYLIDPADLDALIEKSKSAPSAAKKVGPEVGPKLVKTSTKTHQNVAPMTGAKSAEFVVKPNWYKDFR